MTSKTKSTPSTAGLYRTIWRWHFYAGIFCIPFVITLAITGTIYLFKPQIDAWVDKPFNQLKIGSDRAMVDQQIQSALNVFPESKFLSYELPATEPQAVIINLMAEGERQRVYVDPYTLEVLKTIAYKQQFIQLVRTFHGELLAGNIGSVIIELAGCWAIVLIISGLYLWWPRDASGLAGVIYPRIKNKGRPVWRDLHAVLGFWVSVFALFLLISGLPWALVWGSAFKEVRQFVAQQQISHDEHVQHQAQDWTSTRKQESASFRPQAYSGPIHLSNTTLKAIENLQLAHPVELSVNTANPDQWIAKSQHQNRMLRSNVWIDNTSGEVVKREGFQQRAPLDRAISIGISAHEGQLFGWFNQLLGLLTTLALLTIAISGLVMWYQRKPETGLGAPRQLPNARAGKGVVFITLGLALFLPLLAMSLVVIVLVEKFLLKRSKIISQWLGLANN